MNRQNLGVVGSAEVLHLVTDSNRVTRNSKDTFVVGPLADYDVILGMPWLSVWNPTPDFRRKTLHWGSRKHKYRQVAVQSAKDFAKGVKDKFLRLFCVQVRSTEGEGDGLTSLGIPKEY